METTKSRHNIIVFIIAFFQLFFAVPGTCLAKLDRMPDSELGTINGRGVTNFYVEDNTVRLFLDVHSETYGEIDSIKAGYYEKILEGIPSHGWDTNWKNVILGESYENPLVMDGLMVRVEFDDITAQNKRLTSIMVGSNNMTGRISGTFASSTGAIHPGVLGQTGDDPITMNRDETLQGPLDINGGFFIEMNLDSQSSDRGIRTIIGYPESTAINMTFDVGTDWWHQ